ncbi:hypothetical protein C4564_01920, partial [Candidatus Microgenomates bacterium]
MGFFYSDDEAATAKTTTKGVSIETMHSQRCKVCPRGGDLRLRHPKMEATGAKDSELYILGEAPGETEDRVGTQFVGRAGETLRTALRRASVNDEEGVRFNNVIRCRPPDNRTPEPIEIECCRGFIEEDIQRVKPRAIIATGGVPLHWFLPHKESISSWRGRRIPIRVGTHECWLYPIFHPSYVMRSRDQYGSGDVAEVFARDLKRISAELVELPQPDIHTREQLHDGVRLVTDPEDIDKILRKLSKRELLACDLETFAEPVSKSAPSTVFKPQAPNARILSIALSYGERTYVLPYQRDEISHSDQIKIKKSLARFLKSRTGGKTLIFQNSGFDFSWLYYFFREVIDTTTLWHDSQALAYALDERKGMTNLGTLTLLNFGIDIKKYGPNDKS